MFPATIPIRVRSQIWGKVLILFRKRSWTKNACWCYHICQWNISYRQSLFPRSPSRNSILIKSGREFRELAVVLPWWAKEVNSRQWILVAKAEQRFTSSQADSDHFLQRKKKKRKEAFIARYSSLSSWLERKSLRTSLVDFNTSYWILKSLLDDFQRSLANRSVTF